MARGRTTGNGRAGSASRGSAPPERLGCDDRCEGGEPDRTSKSFSSPQAKPLAPALYLVATPIGNAADISLRALAVLAGADVIACEDTRVTSRLLAIHGISRPLVRYDEHTAHTSGPALLRRIAAGETVALVSDAGMPLVSDPGGRLVRDCIEAGLPLTAVPGASSVLTALALSGLPADRFLFAGFLASRSSARRRELAELAGVPATLVLMESAQRLAAALSDMLDVLGDRPAAVARELTKLFEEVRRGPLSRLAAHYAAAGPPRGEITIVIGPPEAPPPVGEDEADRLLADALGRLSARDAVAEVAAATGLSRRLLYARALAMKGEGEEDEGEEDEGGGE